MSLTINVKSAASLPNIEKFSKSDPMAIVIFQGIKHKTKVINNNLDPVWDETFEWPLQVAPSATELIQIDIYDHETIGKNRLLARGEVSMRDVMAKGKYSSPIKLKGKKGDQLQSTITLDITYSSPGGSGGGGGGGGGGGASESAGGDGGGDDGGDDGGDGDGGDEEGEEGEGGIETGEGNEEGEGGDGITAADPSSVGTSVKERRRKARQRKEARAKLPDKPMDFQIRFHVIEARKLQGGGLNPVVKVSCGSQVKGTSSRKGTNNPFFDEMLYFNMNERPKELFDKIVDIRVLNAKVLLLDALIGSFKFDVGMAYDEPGHAFIHKWLLLTDADDPSAGAKGYLKFSINIIGPGDEPVPSPSTLSQDSVDIDSNLLRPSGVRLQSGALHIRIYRAEDLPQMDPGYFEGVKKFLNVGTVQKELVDPYCSVNFAGHKGHTHVIWNEQDPEWNQQINLAIKFPSMCERIRFHLKDKDKINKDDFIGTCFLSLTDISAAGDNGFLPTFGPAFINVYGSPREFTDLPDKFEYLNKGLIEGVSYRGRVLLEVNMSIGKPPSQRFEEIKIVDLKKLAPFLRRRKYKLFAAFFAATMVRPANDPVEFEVSIGNYGNKLDTSAPSQASTTPPTNPAYDGNSYYYLPWMNQKPCVVVESQWEDNSYRIESQNLLLYITEELGVALEKVKKIMKHEKYDHNVCRDILIEAIQEAVGHIRQGLPELPDVGFTRLDTLRRNAREEDLSLMLGEAKELLLTEEGELKDGLTLHPILDAAEEYHTRLSNMAKEPQNSVPDVIIWMLSGKDRVACHRISSNQLMYSTVTKKRGKLCGEVQNILLTPPAVADEEDLEGTEPAGALVRCVMWLGLESDEKKWGRVDQEGEVAVYAETYENQAFFLGKWGEKATMRSKWSDSKGKIKQPKEDFEPPPDGWIWSSDWEISPELSIAFDQDEGRNEWQEDLFEHQNRKPFGGWPNDMTKSSWYDVHGDEFVENRGDTKKPLTREDVELPDGWAWSTQWGTDTNRACDEEGWEYCIEPDLGVWVPYEKNTHFTRRRRWVRSRIRTMDAETMKKKQAKLDKARKEGWEYARFHNQTYHSTEHKMDLARRRRWLRKMTAQDTTKPAIFYFKSKPKGAKRMMTSISSGLSSLRIGKKKEKDETEEDSDSDDDDDDEDGPKLKQQSPRMFLSFDKPHKYQLRVYIYQARDLYASDRSGLSDPYCVVSFDRYSQHTHVISESLCPTWDQTLIFDGIRLYGDPSVVLDSPPPLVIELYDKDTVGQNEILGFVSCIPDVKLNASTSEKSCLEWYEIKRYGQYAGDILASFELLLDDGRMEMPFEPPKDPTERYYIVPSGIRPTLQKTRLEFLCWGVREMRRFRLLHVTCPLVEIECGGNIVKTENIKNAKKNPNFPNPVITMDVLLPKEEKYAPPLNIKILDKRAFGQLPMVGTHIIKTLEDFVVDPTPGIVSRKRAETQEITDVGIRPPSPPAESKDTALVFEDDKKALDNDPDSKESKFDWWSKYYASIKDEQRTQEEYLTEGHDFLKVYHGELEDAFSDFTDLAQTFPLFRGKGKRDPDDPEGQTVGYFKGAIKVYPLPDDGSPDPPKILSHIPSSKPVKVIVRVYIIKGIDLQPQDPNGKSDPYLIVKIGKKKIDDKENYQPSTLNPLFGKIFELPATLPLDHKLTVTVMDYDRITANDLIGETVIDLENRFMTQHRAICGLPESFAKRGPSRWRDYEFPKDILNWYCKTNRLPAPVWISEEEVMFNGKTYNIVNIENEKRKSGLDKRQFKLHPDVGASDQRLALHILHEQGIVPEHIEQRTLYNPMQPGISQGALHMWVDIFPKGVSLPNPVDIAPRKPEQYVLRIIVYNTKDVLLDEVSVATGEAMSDIYVKGWIRGQDETQKTDVHYRSMDGEGNFNWRFVFPFDYLPAEEMMVIKKKEHFYSLDKTEKHLPPRLTLQVWDNDLFNPDDFIGTVDMNLARIPQPRKSAEECSLDQLPEPGREVLTDNLFERKRVKGWWPVYSEEDGERLLNGKLELELEIINLEEAQIRPAGKARDEPNMNPVLTEPIRPATSFAWFSSPLKTFKHIIWKFYKWHIIFGIALVIFIISVIIFIYSAPKFLAEYLLDRLLPF